VGKFDVCVAPLFPFIFVSPRFCYLLAGDSFSPIAHRVPPASIPLARQTKRQWSTDGVDAPSNGSYNVPTVHKEKKTVT
jgi:hypothetical protein